MSAPTPEDQLRFLTNLQRLLTEGQFVATYKYALLLALADIAIEFGNDDGGPLTVKTIQISEKFIHYYWRQCIPYVPRHALDAGQILRQNTGTQAAILQRVTAARQRYGDSLAAARRDRANWKVLLRGVDSIVRQMPLWKLQTVGSSQLDFLYENHGTGCSIELRPGVVFCLRKFYGLVGDLVRSSWVRFIRRHNHDTLGTTSDLAEFLFGSERSDLGVIRTILEDVQANRCFYCRRPMIRELGHVDHFIPWAKYPLDLGHNFVLAHQGCNSDKSDHIPSSDFLTAWVERNIEHRALLAERFNQRGIMHDLSTSARIAEWIYRQTFFAGGLTWQTKKELVKLPVDWNQPIARLITLCKSV